MAKGRRRNVSGAAANAATGAAAGAGTRGRRGRKASNTARLSEIVTRYVSDLVAALNQHLRRNMADEVRDFIASHAGGAAVVAGRTRRAGAGRKRVVQCIAPGCTNPSKGPRFHYLCEKHKDAPKKDYEAWRLRAKQEKQAA
jgi:hypothetical protein